MDIKIGDRCYIIAENFGYRGIGYHYEILEGTIRNVPRGNLHEYDIVSAGRIFGRKRKGVYLNYNDALSVIEGMANDYDRKWERLMGQKMDRPWRSNEDDG